MLRFNGKVSYDQFVEVINKDLTEQQLAIQDAVFVQLQEAKLDTSIQNRLVLLKTGQAVWLKDDYIVDGSLEYYVAAMMEIDRLEKILSRRTL